MTWKQQIAIAFLSSEPYPFRQKHIDELQAKLPGTKIMMSMAKLLAGMAADCYMRLLF
jgi:hypothetical protein